MPPLFPFAFSHIIYYGPVVSVFFAISLPSPMAETTTTPIFNFLIPPARFKEKSLTLKKIYYLRCDAEEHRIPFIVRG